MNRIAPMKATVLAIITIIILWNVHAFAIPGVMPVAGVKIKMEKEWKGYHCGYTEPSRLVIKTEDQWRKVWEKVHRLRLSMPELPEIDFEKEMVVAVFMGVRRSGGYSIEIIKIIETEEEIVVEVEEKQPPPESLRTMALTQPYHIVVIKRSALPVIFQHP